MSRTQQKLQAMTAQELLIQDKKRMIEEKLRSSNGTKPAPERKLTLPFIIKASFFTSSDQLHASKD